MTRSIIEGIDKHTHLSKARLSVNPPFPETMKIEITANCNYKCPYCLTWRSPRNTGNIDKKFLYRILHEAKETGVKEVGLFLLGEPFLVKELPEYIDYAKNKVGIEYVFLTTNGSLCTPSRLKAVIKSGLDSLKFSVNAGNREDYKKMHGVDFFDKVIKNIKWLSKYKKDNNLIKPRTCVSTIYVEDHKETLESFKNMISPYVDEFYYLPLYNQGGHVSGIIDTKNSKKIVGNIGRLENPVSPIPCWELFAAAKISWDGWFTACCFDHENAFIIADLNKVSLIEAWNDPKYVELRKRHLENVGLEKSICAKCLGLK